MKNRTKQTIFFSGCVLVGIASYMVPFTVDHVKAAKEIKAAEISETEATGTQSYLLLTADQIATEMETEDLELQELSAMEAEEVLNGVDGGIYDIVNYWDTDDPNDYLVEWELPNGATYKKVYTVPDAPEDMSEIALSWNGNQDDLSGYTLLFVR